MKNLWCVALVLLLGAQSVFALDLKQAKNQGLVGERSDGYVGFVVKPASAEVKTLVKSVNNKRKTKFSSTAKKNNISIEAVANRFHERALAASKKGSFVQNAQGRWVKK